MAALAPASRASVAFCSFDTAAMTRAPRSAPSSTAAIPKATRRPENEESVPGR